MKKDTGHPGGPEGQRIDLIVEVEDTGIGIPDEFLPIIFESFMQVKSRSSHSGTGLGLAISRKLIRLMNGILTVNSLPGAGSKFAFIIPNVQGETNIEHIDSDRDSILP